MNTNFLWKSISVLSQMCFKTQFFFCLFVFFSFSAGIWNWYSQNLCERVCRAASECLLSASTGSECSAFSNTGDFSSTLILNAGKTPTFVASTFWCLMKRTNSPFYIARIGIFNTFCFWEKSWYIRK